MSGDGYVHFPSVDHPRALLTPDSTVAARFYAHLLGDSVRYGMPGRRRGGHVRAALARQRFPEYLAAAATLRFRRERRPELDALILAITDEWPDDVPRPGEAHVLALLRPTALTVFILSNAGRPLLVAKLPGDERRLAAEADALNAAEGTGIAPRYFGRIGGAFVQEAIRGRPLRIDAIRLRSARTLTWSRRHRELASGLARLAGATASSVPPSELGSPLSAAQQYPLDDQTRAVVAGAARDVLRLNVSALRHRDTSPQNCLFDGNRMTGLVDWENSTAHGVPGYDVLNAAMAFFEHGLALVRWSERRAIKAFRLAWWESPFFAEARSSARDCARAAGVNEQLLEPLEIAFFARRLGRRLESDEHWATGAAANAEMLAVVCAR